MAAGVSSGTYDFKPAVAEFLLEAYERLSIMPSSLTSEHIISARRSANIILSSQFANGGINLFTVELLFIPLVPAVATYGLPENTIDLLDCYIRTYQPSSDQTTLGTALVPMTAAGVPMVTAGGDPMLLSPGSGTLSSVAGSYEVEFYWPANGLQVGDPLFFGCPVSVGDLYLGGFYIVNEVLDTDTVIFRSPTPALITQVGMGATPLFATVNGSVDVQVIIPNHGQSVGADWPVQFETTVGGITIAVGTYDVVSVQNSYTFTIQPGGTATETTAAFENDGQIAIATQADTQATTDVLVYPISRNDYAAIPNKATQGRPTTLWFDRQIRPRLSVWPVPPAPQDPFGIQPVFSPPSTNATNAANPNFYYGLCAYRFKALQDANPIGGQVLDMPKRFFECFVAALVAALAEKFSPAQWQTKLAYAKLRWDEAAAEDREKVSTYGSPDLSGYFR